MAFVLEARLLRTGQWMLCNTTEISTEGVGLLGYRGVPRDARARRRPLVENSVVEEKQ